MSETPESSTHPTPPQAPPAFTVAPPRPDPLYQLAAWVAIVAGILFIIVTTLSVVCWFVWCR
jgi:hypothetical protein